jgi:tRNA dimethylallyltransferase
MIDPPSRGGGDQRLRVERHANPGGGQHRQIVRTIADRYRLRERNPVMGCQSKQRLALGLAGHDRRLHRASNAALPKFETVGDDVIETELCGDPFGEDREPARDKRSNGSSSPHRGDQLPRAWRQPNAADRFFENAIFHAFEQADARLECRGKIDLAVHRAVRDFRNLRSKPKEIRQLVQHFILDDRRLHIGDEKALAPLRRWLDENIDRHAADQRARRLLGSRRGYRIEYEITGLTRREPDRLGRDSEAAGDSRCKETKIRPGAGTGDQGEDHAHQPSSYSDDRHRSKPARTMVNRAPAVIVIAGPTASGKSALALELANTLGAVIINADSLQSYRDLRILTARPDEAAERRVAHRLYGFLDAAERGSAARWRSLALSEIAATVDAGRLPILVGGTGLYLQALEEGLAPVPEIPEQIRQEAIDLHRALGGAAFRERLSQLDPATAGRLFPGDKQRLVRAFEVVRATGVPIGTWRQSKDPRPAYRFATILLAPARDRLYAACDIRFVRMVEAGALAEAAALAARGLDTDLPAMKAVGLPELLSHLRGEVSLGDAISAAQRATRRYAKRQTTWFRHQTKPDLVLSAQFSESLLRCSRHFINRFLLTAPG